MWEVLSHRTEGILTNERITLFIAFRDVKWVGQLSSVDSIFPVTGVHPQRLAYEPVQKWRSGTVWWLGLSGCQSEDHFNYFRLKLTKIVFYLKRSSHFLHLLSCIPLTQSAISKEFKKISQEESEFKLNIAQADREDAFCAGGNSRGNSLRECGNHCDGFRKLTVTHRNKRLCRYKRLLVTD